MIYLDHAATTPLRPEVLAAMQPYFTETFGNAGSTHAAGQAARHAVDAARADIATELYCDPREIIFTSGGTESDNLALRGVMQKPPVQKGVDVAIATSGGCGHMIISTTEHAAVRSTAQQLARAGYELTEIPVDETGRVSAEEVGAAIRPETKLISLMYVNSETGAVQPVREVGKMLEKRREHGEHAPLLHCDAVQAAGTQTLDVRHLKCDLLILSAHKIGGPKGVGLLWSRTDLVPQQTGGGQEHRIRSGTENVPGIVGFAKALQLAAAEREDAVTHLRGIKQLAWQEIQNLAPDTKLNGDLDTDAPHVLNVSFSGMDATMLAMRLDMTGIYVSTGSACSSGATEPSHVIRAMAGEERARSALRISLGRSTTAEEIHQMAKALTEIMTDLKKS